MPNQAATVVTLIKDIKTAIRTVNEQADKVTRITGVKLDIKVTAEDGGDGTVKWEVVEIGANLNNSLVQTLSLELEPGSTGTQGTKEAVNIPDLLVNAIEAIKIGVKEALRSEPPYKLKAATVTLNIGIEQGGKFKLFGIGPAAKDSRTHTITLTLGQP